MKFEIKNRWSGELIFSIETDNWRLAIEAAIKAEANLSEANLSKADLSWSNLSEADLSEANLSKANLSWSNLSKANLSWSNLSEADLSEADLSKANLSEANLSKANLSKANLSWSNLSEADLSKANLSEANLSKANLSWSNLSEADLSKADLRPIKHDVWGVLLYARAEVPFLRAALAEGRVDGSVYRGECACLCGTLAKAKGLDTGEELPFANPSSLAERFFLAIRKGDTPDKSPAAKLALEWVDEFLALTA